MPPSPIGSHARDRRVIRQKSGVASDQAVLSVGMGTSSVQESTARRSSSGQLEEGTRSYSNYLQPEETYNDIMQTSAQRVLSKLKTRQMALSSSIKDNKDNKGPKGKPESSQPSMYLRPAQPMPRKLEPLCPAGGSPESRMSGHRPSLYSLR